MSEENCEVPEVSGGREGKESLVLIRQKTVCRSFVESDSSVTSPMEMRSDLSNSIGLEFDVKSHSPHLRQCFEPSESSCAVQPSGKVLCDRDLFSYSFFFAPSLVVDSLDRSIFWVDEITPLHSLCSSYCTGVWCG